MGADLRGARTKNKNGIPVLNPPRTHGGYVCFSLLSIILFDLIPHNNISIVPWARLSPMQINHDLRTMGIYFQDPEKFGIRTERQTVKSRGEYFS
jgi:hypothetical protein